MRVSGIPNKYEILQEYYYEINGEDITYNEAITRYYQLDDNTRTDFLNYYDDYCKEYYGDDSIEYTPLDENGYGWRYLTDKQRKNSKNILQKRILCTIMEKRSRYEVYGMGKSKTLGHTPSDGVSRRGRHILFDLSHLSEDARECDFGYFVDPVRGARRLVPRYGAYRLRKGNFPVVRSLYGRICEGAR